MTPPSFEAIPYQQNNSKDHHNGIVSDRLQVRTLPSRDHLNHLLNLLQNGYRKSGLGLEYNWFSADGNMSILVIPV